MSLIYSFNNDDRKKLYQWEVNIIEPRILIYVMTLANEKNFTKAARKLHLAQPSLSYQISKLEKELGIELFIRGNRQVVPTYAGKVFISHTIQILDQFQQLKNEIVDIANVKKGQLIIGSLSTTGAYLLPKAISIFNNKFPGIELILIEDTSVNLQLLISQGQIEIALMSLPITNKDLDVEIILEEEIFLAVHPSHWLAEYEEVDLTDCKDEPFIFIKEGNSFRINTQKLCEQAGFEPNIVFESININTCEALVSAGLGIAFVPKMIVNEFELIVKLVYLPIKKGGIKSNREVVMAYKKKRYLSKVARSFIDTIKELNY